jgi:hypothetical protein
MSKSRLRALHLEDIARSGAEKAGTGGGETDAGIATVAAGILSLEAVDLDGLCIQAQALLLVGQELLDILALVALELDHLAHLRVSDDGAIAGELLLDDFEDLLLVEFLGEALDRRQGLTTIALCTRLLARWGKQKVRRWHARGRGQVLTLDTDVNIILTGGLLVANGVFGFRERIEGLEVLDVRGHETGWTVSLLKRGWVSGCWGEECESVSRRRWTGSRGLWGGVLGWAEGDK